MNSFYIPPWRRCHISKDQYQVESISPVDPKFSAQILLHFKGKKSI